MMPKKAFLLVSAVLACGLLLAGCKGRGGFADVDSGDTGDWSAAASAGSSAPLKTADYTKTVELNNSVSFYLDRVAGNGLNAETLSEFKALADDLKTYDFTRDALAKYIGALSRASDCVLGFYYFNSTDRMLADRVAELAAAHEGIGKLEGTSVVLPSAERWQAAAGKFKEYGESQKR